MVDALDEILSSCRNAVIQKAKAFSEKLSCSLIITSRKIDIVKTSPEGFKEVELLPFEFGQACTLLEKVLTEPQKLTAIKAELERIQFQLPLIPLSLMLIVELVEQNKEIPASVTEIYDRFHDIALGRWDQEKGIEVLFEYYIKKFFLASLAYHEFLSKGRLEIEREEFEKAYEDYAKRYNWDKEKLEEFIKEIERAGILSIKTTVTFRHRSFLDYFTAFYIHEQQDEFENLNDFLVKIYFDDIWGDTVFFYVGLKRKINRPLLEKIFTFEEETLSSYIDKFSCGKLLQAGWHSTTDIKSFGIEQASTFAPILRDKILRLFEKTTAKRQTLLSFPEILPDKLKPVVPKIFADIFVLMFSELSFKSMMLFNEVKSFFDTLLNESSQENLYAMLHLLWAMHRFLDNDTFQDIMNACLEKIDKIPDLPAEEEARALVILMLIGGDNKKIAKELTIRAKKLSRYNPGIFRELLPEPPKKRRKLRKKST